MNNKIKKLGYVLSTAAVFVGVQILASGCMTTGGLEEVKPGLIARELHYNKERYDSAEDAKADADDNANDYGDAYWITYEYDPERKEWVNVEDKTECHGGCAGQAGQGDGDDGGDDGGQH